MKTSEVFKAASTRLWDGKSKRREDLRKEQFICHCLEAEHQYLFFDLVKHLGIISDLLEGLTCLESWLYVKHGILVNSSQKNNIKIQKTRKQFLQHLIKHYESIGD